MPQLAIAGGSPVRSDPFPTWPVVSDADVEAVTQAIRDGEWGRMAGSHALDFEREFAAYQGAEYCLALNSGTSALEIGLLAIGIEPGDEVILSPYTYIASAAAILMSGGVPVFVDIDPDTYHIDPSKIAAAITDRTTAIMPVHFAGLACDMGAIGEIARRRGLKIIEDAAHVHGGTWNDAGLGTLGDAGAFSFQSSKNLNSGEGGALLTNDHEVFARAIDYHDVWTGGLIERGGDAGGGSFRAGARWDFPFACHNFRISSYTAALLRSQLSKLEAQTVTRTENGKHLIDLIDRTEGLANVRRDSFATRDSHHLFLLKYKKESFEGLPREMFVEALKAEGIPASLGYPRGCHEQPLFLKPEAYLSRFWPRGPRGEVDIDYASMSCPNVEYLCRNETVWLPQYALLDTRLGMEQIIEAADKIRAHIGELASAEVSV